MLNEQLFQNIVEYVNQSLFKCALDLQDRIHVQFLAQGEYNLNYLIEDSRHQFVLRINTASQMNLSNQILYEYKALELLSSTGVTPKPYYLDDGKRDIPYGLLVMEYLPGQPLSYQTDLIRAAETFATIHGSPFEERSLDFLVKASSPFSALYEEAKRYLMVYFANDHADSNIKRMLNNVLLYAEHKKKDESYFQQEPWNAVINTEVNSRNFIVNRARKTCHLIDWEKPIYGEPAQDLSMFLIPTTTLWKDNYIFTEDEEKQFLLSYIKKLPNSPFVKTLGDRVESFKFFNLLRAISWCALAWTEYTQPDRTLVNMDTFAKIKDYLQEPFLKSCFPAVFRQARRQ